MRESIIGKITSKGQTTVPADVREYLDASSGDSLIWEIRDDGWVVVRKAKVADLAFLAGVDSNLGEWNQEGDEVGYADL